MPRKALLGPDLGWVLNVLRTGQGWSQVELGKAAGVSPNTINDYEHGRKRLSRQKLEFLIGFMGLLPERIDAGLAFRETNRASALASRDVGDRMSETRRRIESLVAEGARQAGDFVRSFMTFLTIEGEGLHARQRAGVLWEHLKRRSPDERLAMVEDSRKFRTWALCERVAAESIALASNHPRQALEMAELAFRIAELTPGEAAWRSRLQGYSLAHIANARRVCNDLPGADEAMARAWKLWEAGSDPGHLNAGLVPALDAVLRRDQRRFRESLKRIDEALAADRGDLRAEILLAKAAIHKILGDPEASTAALFQAAPLINADLQPRNAFALRFNLLEDLCQLGRAAEAAPRLPEVRALAERLGEELDLTRVVWLEGKVAAGIGRTAEAQTALERVRRVFSQRELAFDFALVSLELALLLLEQGRTAEVRALAGQMMWIFRAQGVHRETLAALRMFCDAAKRGAATANLARQVVSFLHRAQLDPGLTFAETATEAETR